MSISMVILIQLTPPRPSKPLDGHMMRCVILKSWEASSSLIGGRQRRKHRQSNMPKIGGRCLVEIITLKQIRNMTVLCVSVLGASGCYVEVSNCLGSVFESISHFHSSENIPMQTVDAGGDYGRRDRIE